MPLGLCKTVGLNPDSSLESLGHLFKTRLSLSIQGKLIPEQNPSTLQSLIYVCVCLYMNIHTHTYIYFLKPGYEAHNMLNIAYKIQFDQHVFFEGEGSLGWLVGWFLQLKCLCMAITVKVTRPLLQNPPLSLRLPFWSVSLPLPPLCPFHGARAFMQPPSDFQSPHSSRPTVSEVDEVS